MRERKGEVGHASVTDGESERVNKQTRQRMVWQERETKRQFEKARDSNAACERESESR